MMIGVARISIEIHNQMIAIAHFDANMNRVRDLVCNQMNATGDQAHSKEIHQELDLRQLVHDHQLVNEHHLVHDHQLVNDHLFVKDHQFMKDHRSEIQIHLDAITV